MPPVVSIITPTGHRERFLPAISRCVVRQQVAWEWLIIDDSPEPSQFMLALAARDSRVRYEHVSERVSIGAKRNRMISESTGSIIAHFDDDDHYAPHYLSRMVGLLAENDAPLIKLSEFYVYATDTEFFGYMDLGGDAGIHYELTGMTTRPCELTIGAHFVLFYGFSYVYRKSLTANAWFEDVDLYDDETFIRRVIENGHVPIAVDDQTQSCLHLVHPTSTSRCYSRYLLPGFFLPRLFPEYEGYPSEIPQV